jgi:hypothetical protein
MLARLLPVVDFLMWQAWLVLGFGLAVVGVAVVAVRHYRDRHRLSALPCEAAETTAAPAHAPASGLSGRRRTPPPPERRSSLRRPGNPVRVVVVDGLTLQNPVDGWVIDRSSGGLRLAVPNPVPVGTLLQVRTTHDPACAPWVQLCVKRCWKRNDLWVVGCQFVRMPPVNVLLLFG